jgi:hypothetical protein
LPGCLGPTEKLGLLDATPRGRTSSEDDGAAKTADASSSATARYEEMRIFRVVDVGEAGDVGGVRGGEAHGSRGPAALI